MRGDARLFYDVPGTVPRGEYLAVLRMLVRRATLLDRWRAYRRPNHWLNDAYRQLARDPG